MARHVLRSCAPFEKPGSTGEKADLVDHDGDFLGHRYRKRLTGVLTFKPHELFGPRLDGIRGTQ